MRVKNTLLQGAKWDASAGQGVFLFFICFAGEHAAGGEDVFTARSAYGAYYTARIEVVAEGSHVLLVACAEVYAGYGMIANEVDANGFQSYKNMLGVIRQPEFTWIVSDTLKTLPPKQFYSGAAELLKTFIIKDPHSYEDAVRVLSSTKEPDALKPLVAKAAKIKASIVSRDENENGLRRVLNLGHTWGHAIEWYQRTHPGTGDFSHGEAVAIGIIQAAAKSEELKIASPGLSDKLKADFAACGLPTRLPFPIEELQEAMHKDKKREDSSINYVLIRRIGKVTVRKI